ncbi:FAD-dependent oxidoreductase [Agrococcus sp. Ld7]|uniref:FAD-dependent oxidoreductase n=1 Tax=Agrococcus sp. Ld7 TaxID=649148 RepID=UPI00386A8437
MSAMLILESDVLIVGAGAAGHSVAVALRALGFAGSVRIVQDEPHPPYNRTLVDKGILPGLLTVEQAALKDLTPLDIDLVRGRGIVVDETRPATRLQDGRALTSRALLLAMGSSPRPLPGGAGPGVFSLHRADDAMRIRDHLGDDPAGRAVTVLGAGLVGSEVASYFAAAGAGVQLVARSDVPLTRVLGRPIATQLRDLHAAHVDIHFGRAVTALLPSASHTGVRLDDGSELRSDLVIVAQGAVPDTSRTTVTTRRRARISMTRSSCCPTSPTSMPTPTTRTAGCATRRCSKRSTSTRTTTCASATALHTTD